MSRSEVLWSSPDGLETPDGAIQVPEYGYNLPQMDQADFHKINAMVLAVLSTQRKRRRSQARMRTVTVDSTGFSDGHAEYVNSGKVVGCALTDVGAMNQYFDVWMTPTYFDGYWFRLTLAHELTHGYVGIDYQHSAHWRRWFYRVICHLQMEYLLRATPFDAASGDLQAQCFYAGYRYVKDPKNYPREKTLAYEALRQARQDHPAVLAEYRRLSSLPF